MVDRIGKMSKERSRGWRKDEQGNRCRGWLSESLVRAATMPRERPRKFFVGFAKENFFREEWLFQDERIFDNTHI